MTLKVCKWVRRSLLRSAIGRYQKLFIDLDHNDPFDGQNRCRLKINISVSSEMFRIFDDVKIISTTPPAIYVDYYFCSRKTKAKSSSRFFSIIKTSCSVGCHWTMICAAASLIFRDTHGRNCICTRYTHNKFVEGQFYTVAR